MTRTRDLLITNQLLYQLSYSSKIDCAIPDFAIIAQPPPIVKWFFQFSAGAERKALSATQNR